MIRLVQFQAMQRGDYFCVYALDDRGRLWEREISLMMESGRGDSMATWKLLGNPEEKP